MKKKNDLLCHVRKRHSFTIVFLESLHLLFEKKPERHYFDHIKNRKTITH